MKRTRPKTIADLRQRFPIGATVFFKGVPLGTVCGYNRWINGSYENEPEVLYVNWRVKQGYPAQIGQFTIRSYHYGVRPYELHAYTHHPSGIGWSSHRVLTVYFDPRTEFGRGPVWFDETNREWAIWEDDLHKVIR